MATSTTRIIVTRARSRSLYVRIGLVILAADAMLMLALPLVFVLGKYLAL